MTTLRIRALVSLVATLVLTLALGSCASSAARSTVEAPAPALAPTSLRFDNSGREYVRVYLVGQRREWLLGRVEPGAAATLRLPDGSMQEGAGLVQLVVLSGGPVTLQAARDPRARLTITQPATALLSQRWSFAQGEIMSRRRSAASAEGGDW